MNRYLYALVIVLGIPLGIYIAFSVIFFAVWKVIFGKMLNRRLLHKEHMIFAAGIWTSVAIMGGIGMMVGIDDLVFGMECVGRPLLYLVPVASSYTGMILAYLHTSVRDICKNARSSSAGKPGPTGKPGGPSEW